jgi:PAS domain-containing protein
VKGEQVGTLYLRSDYKRTFLELLRFYGLVVLGITCVSIGLAVFLSSRLGRRITHPILELARTAQIVGEKKDYSVRAAVSSQGDELGRLSESFNEMLSRIQSQDAALSLSQQKMEALIHSIDGIVWERTPDTFRFTFVSRQSEDILGYAPAAWLEKPNFWEESLLPQDGGPRSALYQRIPNDRRRWPDDLDPGERHGVDGEWQTQRAARHLPGHHPAKTGRGTTGQAQPAID